jgi:CRP/FNR family transcriptional regulator
METSRRQAEEETMELPRRHNLIRELRQTNCSDCALNPVCLPPAIEDGEIQQLDDIINRNRPIARGGVLFHEGMPFEAVFAVRSGAIKTCNATPTGEEQVTGFYLPGEIVGLDSIGNPSGNYGSTAIALETTAVCALPFDALEDLAGKLPSLQHHLFRLMSSEIRADQQIMQLVGRRTADERIATFLLTLAARYKRRNLSENHLHLPMSRSDIANHLGLALETVSRIFTRFQTQGVLKVNGREVEIADRARLRELANGETEPVANCNS